MRAIGYYIVLDELKEDIKETKGGLLLSEKHREDIRYRRGKVLSVGSMVEGVKPDDIVWFDKAAGHQIELDAIHQVIRATDVVIVE